MKWVNTLWLFFFALYATGVAGQSVTTFLPEKFSKTDKYLFYLHGGVVTVLGDNAINQAMPEWGPYEYLNILNTLHNYGFHVISENRKPDINDSIYASRLARQIDTLLRRGVKERNIIVVAASAGTTIAINTSALLKHKSIKYVLIGGCWPETYKDYQHLVLNGYFLSIIEVTDPHGTCYKIFENRTTISGFEEITLHTGLSHGFFYKPKKEWIDPIIKWFNDK